MTDLAARVTSTRSVIVFLFVFPVASVVDKSAFASTDGGTTWKNADYCDSFDDSASADRALYVGSQGREIWRIQYQLPPQPSITPPGGRRVP